MKTQTLHPLHRELLELHVFAMDRLAQTSAAKSVASRVRRATTNASIAVELAVEGHSPRGNIRRAQKAAITSRALFRFLFMERRISAKVYEEFLRRIDQILTGLEQLHTTPHDQWRTLAPPPREAPRSVDDELGPARTLQELVRMVLEPTAPADEDIVEDYLEFDSLSEPRTG